MKKVILFFVFIMIFSVNIFGNNFVDYKIDSYSNTTSSQYKEIKELDKYYEGIKTYFYIKDNPSVLTPNIILLGVTTGVYGKDALSNKSGKPYDDLKIIYNHMLYSYCNYSIYERFNDPIEISQNIANLNLYIINLKSQLY